eukprot:7232774-Prymnesium_polylepis.1
MSGWDLARSTVKERLGLLKDVHHDSPDWHRTRAWQPRPQRTGGASRHRASHRGEAERVEGGQGEDGLGGRDLRHASTRLEDQAGCAAGTGGSYPERDARVNIRRARVRGRRLERAHLREPNRHADGRDQAEDGIRSFGRRAGQILARQRCVEDRHGAGPCRDRDSRGEAAQVSSGWVAFHSRKRRCEKTDQRVPPLEDGSWCSCWGCSFFCSRRVAVTELPDQQCRASAVEFARAELSADSSGRATAETTSAGSNGILKV